MIEISKFSGASLNIKNKNGKTALGLAVYWGCREAAKTLREAGDRTI